MNQKEHYNTQRERLRLPEYGRHIQEMVEYLKSVEDKAERTRLAKSLVSIMANFNPGLKDNQDFKTKLWNHLAMLSGYQLDIDYPCEITSPEELSRPPSKITYPAGRVKYKHYGKNAENLVKAFADMEDNESRQVLTEMLANHMKKLYLVWNKEAVNDELIFNDMNDMAGGKKIIEAPIKLNETRDILFRNKKTQAPPPKKNHRKK